MLESKMLNLQTPKIVQSNLISTLSGFQISIDQSLLIQNELLFGLFANIFHHLNIIEENK